jgi:hypothetical protein
MKDVTTPLRKLATLLSIQSKQETLDLDTQSFRLAPERSFFSSTKIQLKFYPMVSIPKEFIRKILTLFFFLSLLSCSDQEPSLVYELKPEEHTSIVFIGNTFAERLQNYNYFEPLLHKSFPDKKLTIRNLGWSADEVGVRSRPLNFPTQDEFLSEHKADVIIACYGLNEAFKGPDSLNSFKEQLKTYLTHLQSQLYNGHTNPQLILVSPIAHEKKGELSPDPAPHNKNLALYTKGMKEVANGLGVPFVNLFNPTKKDFLEEGPSTINGIHLNERGYKKISEFLAAFLGLPVSKWDPAFAGLKKLLLPLPRGKQRIHCG